jgi:hypothetical protein
MSRGSFCMSPSIVATIAACADSTPAITAALWPEFFSSRTMRSQSARCCCFHSRMRCRLPSRLPSSTATVSNGPCGSSTSATSASSACTFASSSKIGTTSEKRSPVRAGVIVSPRACARRRRRCGGRGPRG